MTTQLLRITTKVLLSLLLLVIVGALSVLFVVPRAVNGSALTVLTGSMTPTIPVGSVVVVRPVDPGTLHVGDVITYQKDPGRPVFVTHRIVKIHTDTKPVTLTTKGDANRGPDLSPVPVTAVRGRVLFHVPYLGTIRNSVSGGKLALPLAIAALLGYGLLQLWSARRDRRAAVGQPELLQATAPLVALQQDGLAVQMLVATLHVREFEGLTARAVADLLRMQLLEERDGFFTVAVARTTTCADKLAELLTAFAPVFLERSNVLPVPGCGESIASADQVVEEACGASV